MKNAFKDIKTEIIGKENSSDINIPNEPFEIFGRMIPEYKDEKWSYKTERFSDTYEMCFPDENYSFDKMSENCVFIGAYDEGKCIGLAIMQRDYFKYMYLYDLKVNAQYRSSGVASALIEKAVQVAKAEGYSGIYTIGQDNNLGACLFYLKNGFVIGGLNTKVYCGTIQEDKKDIYFYLDF